VYVKLSAARDALSKSYRMNQCPASAQWGKLG
jgi:hypothetical protein